VTFVPLVITTLCYLWVAYGYFSTGHYGLAWAFLGYAWANGGFFTFALPVSPNRGLCKANATQDAFV
jgi:hypothetical protein